MDLSFLSSEVKNGNDGQKGSKRGGQRNAEGEGAEPCHHGEDGADGSAAGDSENIGIGKGISEEGLKDGA